MSSRSVSNLQTRLEGELTVVNQIQIERGSFMVLVYLNFWMKTFVEDVIKRKFYVNQGKILIRFTDIDYQ